MNSPASGSSSALPQTHLVTPCSSSSAPLLPLAVSVEVASDFGSSSDGVDCLSLSLPFLLFLEFVAVGGAILSCSSAFSSGSSCLDLLDREEELEGVRRGSAERGGADSETGEGAGDLLDDTDGAERRPERRGSLGEGGGPM